MLNPILNVLIALHNKGKTDTYVYAVENQLKHIQKYADLSNPETVKAFIADKAGTNNYKRLLCTAYNFYCQHYQITWQMPNYEPDDKMPRLPTEEQLNKLISASGKTLSLKLWISKETGIRPTELHALTVRDIDLSHNAIIPRTAKHGCARTLTIPPNLTKALEQHITQNNLGINDKLFKSNARKYGDNYRQMRKRLAERTNDPSLMTVRLYDFRHWFATMRYWKYRDIPLTAEDMGHKDYNTTRKYIHLLKILEMIKEDEWICKVASNIEESKQLIEHGFEYVTEQEGMKLYRKRK